METTKIWGQASCGDLAPTARDAAHGSKVLAKSNGRIVGICTLSLCQATPRYTQGPSVMMKQLADHCTGNSMMQSYHVVSSSRFIMS